MTAIRTVAVLGAGTMGAQIAALAAGSGLRVLLLDRSATLAANGLARARRLTPPPAFTPADWSAITTGGFETHLGEAAGCDWVIEAIVEDAGAKTALLARVDASRAADTIVTTNTSALSIASLAEGRTAGFRAHWAGTHFFNPPRYLPLLECVPGPEMAPAALARLRQCCDHVLGKGVVLARDTPGFIGNHVALYATARILAAVDDGLVSIEEADALTGPVIGRPKSATFRTLDLAGLDVVAQVCADLAARLPDADARRVLAVPASLARLVAAGALGEKTGRGYYRRVRQPDGTSTIDTVDLATLGYRSATPVDLPSLTAVRRITDTGARLRQLFGATDRGGVFLRRTLAPALIYAARVTPGIAASADDVDHVLRWGFGWELGPFEIIDAIGAGAVWDAARETDPELTAPGPPPLLADAIATGGRVRAGRVPPAAPDLLLLRSARERTPVVASTPGASLVDLGEGVLAVEFHSKMNTLGHDAVAMLHRGVEEAEARFEALVITNEGAQFSAGADLTLVAGAAEARDWPAIDGMVRGLQDAVLRLQSARVPVVTAPFGLSLGGGTEITLRTHGVQAAAETYLGLVETGVGLIPGGGGTVAMLLRALDAAGTDDPMPHIQRAFETIALAKVSGSAMDARRLGFLRPADGITMNRERLSSDARESARALARLGHGGRPPLTRVRVGGDAVYAPLALGVHLAWRAGQISDHDARIGRTLAAVLAGGRRPCATTLGERDLLDLEREAFLSLVGTPETQARIRHTLATGKPLRN